MILYYSGHAISDAVFLNLITFFEIPDMKYRFEGEVELFPKTKVRRFESDCLCRNDVIV